MCPRSKPFCRCRLTISSPAARRVVHVPLVILLVGISALAMMVPAGFASLTDADATARAFFYPGMLFLILAGLATIAAASLRPVTSPAARLVELVLAYMLLPVVLAVPFAEAVRDTRFLNAYLEMISALTTTGASFFEPDRLDPALHLWRGLVGWMGGFLIWVTAMVVLAPLNLGGFEVSSQAIDPSDTTLGPGGTVPGIAGRQALGRAVRDLLPIYAGLTGVLWLVLVILGETGLTAAIHAMATLSTSAISPVGGLEGSTAGLPGEILVFLFFAFALSRRTFLSGFGADLFDRLGKDREIRLAISAVAALTALMFARHWVGALEVDEVSNSSGALAALWGSLFTVLSFLTTTGFVSESWADARAWSGLPTPGLLLIGLCLMGGGVATTAGGIKLLRVYALYKHGLREIEKLVHPHSVASAGRLGRRIRREGAYIAWIFFMLFILSLAAIALAFALTGLEFDAAMTLAVAALTTTGPLAEYGANDPIRYAQLTDAAKWIFAGAMIVGRLELLVLVALFNPAFWRS